MKILAPAKINLFLEVTGRRPDGYHNIVSLIRAVTLYDRIVIKPKRRGIALKCSLRNLPVDKTNLAMKAAILLKNELKIDKGADIYLEKNIPVGAGLGGGSSDAAAVLKGLLKLWKKELPEKKLLDISKKLGADVPFFIRGGAAVARGIGERLESLENIEPARILLANPGFRIATKQVYNNLRFPLTKKQKINRILKLLRAWAPPQEWGKLMFNRLEEAVLTRHPEISRAKKILESCGFNSIMSGSGSTVFGVLSAGKTGKKAVSALKRHGWKCWLVKTIA